MKRMLRWIVVAWLSCFAAIAWGKTDYPNATVRIVVPFAPGGLADAMARALADRLTSRLGESVVVDNRPGGNTVIAAQYVANAKPDGYTLLMATDATLSVLPFIYDKLPFNPQTDFRGILPVAQAIPFLAVRSDMPANSVAELVKLAKTKPGALSYSSQGVGSNSHFSGELLNRLAGVNITHIPYKGLSGAVNGLLGGQIDLTFSNIMPIRSHIEAGNVKVLAYLGEKRSRHAPDVPTIAEAGYPGMESIAWFGLVAPSKTPKDIIDKLALEIREIIREPSFEEKFITNVGMEPANVPDADAFDAFLIKDRLKYQKKVAQTGIHIK